MKNCSWPQNNHDLTQNEKFFWKLHNCALFVINAVFSDVKIRHKHVTSTKFWSRTRICNLGQTSLFRVYYQPEWHHSLLILRESLILHWSCLNTAYQLQSLLSFCARFDAFGDKMASVIALQRHCTRDTVIKWHNRDEFDACPNFQMSLKAAPFASPRKAARRFRCSQTSLSTTYRHDQQ